MKLRGNRLNKGLDRYVGIPLLWLLSRWNALAHRRRERPLDRSVLCIQIGTIGDAVLTLPALRYLKQRGFHCTVLASKANEHVYLVAGYTVILFDLQTVLTSPAALIKQISSLRAAAFDYILDFNPWLRFSAMVAGLLKTSGNRLIGFRSKGQLRGCIFDQAIVHSPAIHESENYLHLAQNLAGGEATVRELAECVPREKIDALVNHGELKQKLQFDLPATDYAVFHPWSAGYRGRDKEWAIENYLKLAESLPPNFKILITGTEADRDRTRIFQNRPRIFNIAGLTNLAETMAIISRARFVVTVNTGILHIASWLGKDIICLNGPAGELRWGALKILEGQRIIHLNASVPCSPCLNLGFEYKCQKMFCMPTITISMVVNAVKSLLLTAPPEDILLGTVKPRPAPSETRAPVRTGVIRDVTLSDLPAAAAALRQQVDAAGFEPTCLVYLETGGRLLAAELSKQFNVGVVPLSIHRHGMEFKIRLARLLVRLPTPVKNALRQWEVRQAWRRQGRQRDSGEIARVDLTGARVLIVDDAVDTGFSVRTARNWAIAMGAKPAEIKIAALTVTMDLGKGLPDFALYYQICRFPWSSDSAERDAYQRIYNQLDLAKYPSSPSVGALVSR